jgi:hypothetical protein
MHIRNGNHHRLLAMKTFAFPQFPRGEYRTVPIMSDKLLGDLAQLARTESRYAKNMPDYINLHWIAEDIERRRRALRKVRP